MIVYLYVKRHRKTGLLYFGKTTKNPLKYNGSGKYWKSHLRKHGSDVETLVASTVLSSTTKRVIKPTFELGVVLKA